MQSFKQNPISPQGGKLSTAVSFIVLMGVLGAALGVIGTQMELKKCLNSEACTLIGWQQKQTQAIQQGAIAGMSSALIVSLPALLNRSRKQG